MTKPLLISFDFDHTIANKNTDQVAREMVSGEIPDSLNKVSGWTAYMRNIFKLLHNDGIKQEDIKNKITGILATPGYEKLLTNLHSHNCEIIIISDSNSIFIDDWLNHKQLDHLIAKIFTNPAYYDENGLLHIEQYHEQDWCKLSEKNLCKGYILENYIKEQANKGVTYDKIAYAGDGTNDFCPMLKLSDKDLAFPRANYSIMKLLNKTGNVNVVKAEIIPWKNGDDIWQAITTRINF